MRQVSSRAPRHPLSHAEAQLVLQGTGVTFIRAGRVPKSELSPSKEQHQISGKMTFYYRKHNGRTFAKYLKLSAVPQN